MRKWTAVLLIMLLFIGCCSAASAAPEACANCGQNRVILVYCSNQLSFMSSADCLANATCGAYLENYRTRYECPYCDWYEITGYHAHKIVHSICEDEWKCIFSEQTAYYYYPETGVYSSQYVAK